MGLVQDGNEGGQVHQECGKGELKHDASSTIWSILNPKAMSSKVEDEVDEAQEKAKDVG